MSKAFSSRVLLAGAALLASTALASAATVRVTVAEYSAKTGPYFEKVASAFEAQNPDTDIQIEVVPWDVLQQNSRPTSRATQRRQLPSSARAG
jgi:multiple sugar transport system substrate-binding protein